jgi:hypothetical protein
LVFTAHFNFYPDVQFTSIYCKMSFFSELFPTCLCIQWYLTYYSRIYELFSGVLL